MQHIPLHILAGLRQEANDKGTGKERFRNGLMHQVNPVDGILGNCLNVAENILQHSLRQVLGAEVVLPGQPPRFAEFIPLALGQLQRLLPVGVQLLLHPGQGAERPDNIQRTVNGIVVQFYGLVQVLQAAIIIPAQPPSAPNEVGISSGNGLQLTNGTVTQGDAIAGAPQQMQCIHHIGIPFRHHRAACYLPVFHILFRFQILDAVFLLKMQPGKCRQLLIHINDCFFALRSIFPLGGECSFRQLF